MNNLWAREFNTNDFFVEGREYVHLDPLYVSYYPWQRIKISSPDSNG